MRTSLERQYNACAQKINLMLGCIIYMEENVPSYNGILTVCYVSLMLVTWLFYIVRIVARGFETLSTTEASSSTAPRSRRESAREDYTLLKKLNYKMPMCFGGCRKIKPGFTDYFVQFKNTQTDFLFWRQIKLC